LIPWGWVGLAEYKSLAAFLVQTLSTNTCSTSIMHYFLLAFLLFPLLLHSYIIANRKSRHGLDLSLIDCRQSLSGKAETPTNGPPVVVKVDNCMKHTRSRRHSNPAPTKAILSQPKRNPQSKFSRIWARQTCFSSLSGNVAPIQRTSQARTVRMLTIDGGVKANHDLDTTIIRACLNYCL
jgi:hypothetical protein